MKYFFKFFWLSQNIWTLREEDYVSSRISAGGLEIRNNNADTIKTYYVSVYYYVWTGKMSGSEVFKKSQEYPTLPNTRDRSITTWTRGGRLGVKKMPICVDVQGKKCPFGGKKGHNYVHVVIEWPLLYSITEVQIIRLQSFFRCGASSYLEIALGVKTFIIQQRSHSKLICAAGAD